MKLYMNATQLSILRICLEAGRDDSLNSYTASNCGKAAIIELLTKVRALENSKEAKREASQPK